MSPILVRPVREQLEHDRLIRHLEARYKKKQEVGVNTGDQQDHPLKVGNLVLFPDIVVTDGRKPVAVVEVETGESVNNLEALAQWVHFSRARVAFHLYVPVQGYDAARRLCHALGVKPTEIWSYRPEVEGFDLVRMHAEPSSRSPRASTPTRPAKKAAVGARSDGGRKAAPAPAKSGVSSRTGAKSRPASRGAVGAASKPARAKASRGAGPTGRTATAGATRSAKTRRPAAAKAARKGSSGRRK